MHAGRRREARAGVRDSSKKLADDPEPSTRASIVIGATQIEEQQCHQVNGALAFVRAVNFSLLCEGIHSTSNSRSVKVAAISRTVSNQRRGIRLFIYLFWILSAEFHRLGIYPDKPIADIFGIQSVKSKPYLLNGSRDDRFLSITITSEEVSLVMEEKSFSSLPSEFCSRMERNANSWKAIQISAGPMGFCKLRAIYDILLPRVTRAVYLWNAF